MCGDSAKNNSNIKNSHKYMPKSIEDYLKRKNA